METFDIIEKTENEIVLASEADLGAVADLIEKEENFILSWDKNDVVFSELIISNNIASKVKNGELRLTSRGEE